MIISKIDPTLTIAKLQTISENQYFDRKSARLAARDFAHQLCAFANAAGGTVVIGIEDDGRITGVDAEQENIFRKAAFEHLQIPPAYEVEIIECDSCENTNCNIIKYNNNGLFDTIARRLL